MSTAALNPDDAPREAPAVETSDRLIFTVLLAVALHALIILGITFTSHLSGKAAPTLEITLATHNSQKAPDKADYLAQFNQEASGAADKSLPMTTDQQAPLADNQIHQVNPTPMVKASKPVTTTQRQPVTTISESPFKVARTPISPEQEEEELQGTDPVDTPLSAEIASLRAKLDKQRQAIAKRPRRRTLTSVATKASADAEYLAKWTQKVEFVGNRNFPEQALQQRLFGKLRLLTILRPNGTIESVQILHSSGYPVLDQAALQIVHLAAPYPPFPPEIRKDVDLLEIIRTWHFEIDGLSTTNTP